MYTFSLRISIFQLLPQPQPHYKGIQNQNSFHDVRDHQQYRRTCRDQDNNSHGIKLTCLPSQHHLVTCSHKSALMEICISQDACDTA